MPNINLRLTELEHAELREWAHGSRRSLQREIVFRLFDGAVTERGGRNGVQGDPAPLAEESVGHETKELPRSVTAAVPPTVHDVPMRWHYRADRPGTQLCDERVSAGHVCSKCGRNV